ncbi:aminotransferase class V-fold PLP-dependent enzyme [Pseudoroseicyclus sp. CXY001]|uniref:aminotransferase class V-fold PLP-dependent enzyme n=1 Tax=Pseudoroseicyclus sp. CXY001 TaxID=3242492 RepID=UPI003570F125
MDIDTSWVRRQFPAFAEPSLAGWAFFENAGGSYACAPVIDRLTRFYRERKMQPYAPNPAATAGGAEMDEARARLAEMLGVATHELSFGPSTSQNTYVLAQSVRGWLTPGEAIVVSEQDHEANAGVWRRLADAGIEVREWKLDPETGLLPMGALPALLDGAKLLCFPHCSNVIGAINDVAAICALAREAGVRTVVDGVSYAPHGLPDVGALGADVYLFSAYKTYGPHQGLMVIREDFGMALPGQGHSFNNGSLYKRFTPAGPDHAQVAASAGIADYIEALSAHHGGPAAGAAAARHAHKLMQAREQALMAPLLDYLGGRNDLRLLGPRDAAARAPTIALELQGEAEPVSERLADHKVMAWGGDFYAVRPLGALGIPLDKGVLRLSFTHYTSPDEVDQLIAALDAEL